jgi:hypothetical protein
MADQTDWRIQGREKYLKGVTLRWKVYTEFSPHWDHDHCEFCWAKFMNNDLPELLREGYVTLDGDRWICKKCYDDFREMFDWKVQTPE